MERHCVFCDAEISAGAPPEHVLPKWLGRRFRPKGAVFKHTERPEIRGDKEYPPAVPDYQSKKFDLTAKTVCAKCNHKWMSDLETQASPLLVPMIEGKARDLSVEQQALLSGWVAKTALTWDQSQPPNRRLFPLELCRALYKHRLPPPGSRVRLARYEGESPEFVQMIYDGLYSEVPDDPVSPGAPQAHRAAIRIGQLVAEFVVADDPGAVIRETGDIGSLLLTIWPSVSGHRWPPPVVMVDDIWTRFVGPDKLNKGAPEQP